MESLDKLRLSVVELRNGFALLVPQPIFVFPKELPDASVLKRFDVVPH